MDFTRKTEYLVLRPSCLEALLELVEALWDHKRVGGYILHVVVHLCFTARRAPSTSDKKYGIDTVHGSAIAATEYQVRL